MTQNKISVVMPAYNAAQYIKLAMESILNQTYKNFEFIIVDDDSTDNTAEIIKSYHDDRIVYIRNECNLGIAGALNRGLAAAQGKYIALMNADDISLPERLKKQLKYLERRADVALLGTAAEFIGPDGEWRRDEIKSSSDKVIKWQMLFDYAFVNGTIIFRREILKALAGYSEAEEHNWVEDYEFVSRVSEKYKLGNLKEKLYQYRLHPSSHEQILRLNSQKLCYKNLISYVDLDLSDARDYYLAIAGELNDRLKIKRVIKFHRKAWLNFILKNRLSFYDKVLIFKDYLRVYLIILRNNDYSGNPVMKIVIKFIYCIIKFFRNLFFRLRY